MFAPRDTHVASERTVDTTPEYATPPVYAVPQHGAYAAPSLESGDAYNDEFGWGPHLRTSTTDVPSAQRLGTIPRHDFRPDPLRAPQEWYGKLDADDAKRHSVEDQDADGWTEIKGLNPGDLRWAPNPRLKPPPEPRPTTSMSPSTYSFTRPFDQHSARTFNGQHFSMADHRRNYDILGMAPVRSTRNTYRIEPVPWDVDVVDMPPVTDPTPVEARIRSVEVPFNTRSYRLG
jgi:hypothetical protein